MLPKSYLKKFKIRQIRAAENLGLKPAAFNHKINGRRQWTPAEAKAWEVWTRGMVSRMDILYPDE